MRGNPHVRFQEGGGGAIPCSYSTAQLRLASFQVSDYLAEALIEVVEGIVRMIMNRIRGEEQDYPEETVK